MLYNTFMDKAKIKKVENYLFWHCKRRYDAGSIMSNIIGVIINLKPSCSCILNERNVRKFNIVRFTKLLEKLDLKVISKRTLSSNEYDLNFYISKSLKKAMRLKELFEVLNNYNFGDDERKDIHSEIGELLGYPKTAVNYFVRNVERGSLSESHKQRVKKYFYYAHSEAYQNKEFKEYDERLNRALDKYSVRSAKALRKKYPQKRWLD